MFKLTGGSKILIIKNVINEIMLLIYINNKQCGCDVRNTHGTDRVEPGRDMAAR